MYECFACMLAWFPGIRHDCEPHAGEENPRSSACLFVLYKIESQEPYADLELITYWKMTLNFWFSWFSLEGELKVCLIMPGFPLSFVFSFLFFLIITVCMWGQEGVQTIRPVCWSEDNLAMVLGLSFHWVWLLRNKWKLSGSHLCKCLYPVSHLTGLPN